MAHLVVVVYDSFNRKNIKISTTYYFLDFSFFMSQDDAHYQNHLNAPVDADHGDDDDDDDDRNLFELPSCFLDRLSAPAGSLTGLAGRLGNIRPA